MKLTMGAVYNPIVCLPPKMKSNCCLIFHPSDLFLFPQLVSTFSIPPDKPAATTAIFENLISKIRNIDDCTDCSGNANKFTLWAKFSNRDFFDESDEYDGTRSNLDFDDITDGEIYRQQLDITINLYRSPKNQVLLAFWRNVGDIFAFWRVYEFVCSC